MLKSLDNLILVICLIFILILGVVLFNQIINNLALKTEFNNTIDVSEVVYSFKIMEIQSRSNGSILRGIDGIEILLNGDDFIHHAPGINDFFIMHKDGRIQIIRS